MRLRYSTSAGSRCRSVQTHSVAVVSFEYLDRRIVPSTAVEYGTWRELPQLGCTHPFFPAPLIPVLHNAIFAPIWLSRAFVAAKEYVPGIKGCSNIAGYSNKRDLNRKLIASLADAAASIIVAALGYAQDAHSEPELETKLLVGRQPGEGPSALFKALTPVVRIINNDRHFPP